jgi:hypothetical protein
MKTALVTLVLATFSVVVLGQGKITIENNQHPVYLWWYSGGIHPLDAGKAGQVLPYGDAADPMPSGKVILFGLYGGSSSTSLSLLTYVPVNDGNELDNGRILPLNFTLPTGFPAGTPAFFQVLLWDAPYHSFYESILFGGG